MTVDLDTFLVARSTIVDELYQRRVAPQRPRRRGRRPDLSDSDVVTLTICEQWHGRSERGVLRFARRYWRGYFPRLLDQRSFNRRVRDLTGVLTPLVPLVADDLGASAASPPNRRVSWSTTSIGGRVVADADGAAAASVAVCAAGSASGDTLMPSPCSRARAGAVRARDGSGHPGQRPGQEERLPNHQVHVDAEQPRGPCAPGDGADRAAHRHPGQQERQPDDQPERQQQHQQLDRRDDHVAGKLVLHEAHTR